MPTTRCYRSGRLDAENFPVEEISEHLALPDAVVWLDLCAPDSEQLERAAAEFGLHALAVEDALHPGQRPKVDIYDTHSFLNVYGVQLDIASGELTTSEVAAFMTPQALITVRKDDSFDMGTVVARWDSTAAQGRHGVGFLVHGLLDHVVDGHFEAVQQLDEAIERLEDLLFSQRPRGVEVQRRSFELRKSLVLLRRVVLPMREVINTLLRRDTGLVSPEMVPYFQDIYDHVLRAFEWTESLRDLVSSILEENLMIQGNQMNLVMKKVTSWAAIIAVPTAITGYFGQNVPYPGFSSRAGFIASTLMILVLSVGLYISFRRKQWI